MFKLSISTRPFEKQYLVKAASRWILMDRLYESCEEASISFRLTGSENNAFYFQLTTENTSKLSNWDDFDWVSEFSEVLKHLVLQTNQEGKIVQVMNKKELQDQWHKNRAKVKSKYRKLAGIEEQLNGIHQLLAVEGYLEEYLNQQTMYAILFPSVFGEYKEEQSLLKEKSIPTFLGEQDLPLLTKSYPTGVSLSANGCQIEVEGRLHEEKFAKKPFVKWLKNTVDIYDLKVILAVDFEEKYLFDQYNSLTYAEQFVSADVEGIYSHTLARTLEERPI